jgi:hypothetical protein
MRRVSWANVPTHSHGDTYRSSEFISHAYRRAEIVSSTHGARRTGGGITGHSSNSRLACNRCITHHGTSQV